MDTNEDVGGETNSVTKEDFSVDCFANWDNISDLAQKFANDLTESPASAWVGHKDAVVVGKIVTVYTLARDFTIDGWDGAESPTHTCHIRRNVGSIEEVNAAVDDGWEEVEPDEYYGAELADIRFATLGPDAPFRMDNVFNPDGKRCLKMVASIGILFAYFKLLADKHDKNIWLVDNAVENPNYCNWTIYFVPRNLSPAKLLATTYVAVCADTATNVDAATCTETHTANDNTVAAETIESS